MTGQTFGVMVGLVVVVVAVAAYGEKVVSRSDRKDRVTVVYWEKWTGAEADEMRKTVNAFNDSQDKIFVKYLSISGVDQKTLLLLRKSAISVILSR